MPAAYRKKKTGERECGGDEEKIGERERVGMHDERRKVLKQAIS